MTARPKDVYAGAIFIAIGLAAFFGAQQYEVGTARNMGPGYLPAMMGVVLVILGGFSLANAARSRTPDPIAKSSLEPFVLVVASVVAFALLIDRAGLVVALVALVLISSLRRLFSHPIEVLAIAVGLAVFCVLLFSLGLGMAMPLWPW